MGVFAREFSDIVAVNLVCWYVYSDRNGTVAFACTPCLRKANYCKCNISSPHLSKGNGHCSYFLMPMILYSTEFHIINLLIAGIPCLRKGQLLQMQYLLCHISYANYCKCNISYAISLHPMGLGKGNGYVSYANDTLQYRVSQDP